MLGSSATVVTCVWKLGVSASLQPRPLWLFWGRFAPTRICVPIFCSYPGLTAGQRRRPPPAHRDKTETSRPAISVAATELPTLLALKPDWDRTDRSNLSRRQTAV